MSMLVWEYINITLVATETRTNKCKRISVNLLVGTGTSDKAFPYVLQEYTAYCNVLAKLYICVIFTCYKAYKLFIINKIS